MKLAGCRNNQHFKEVYYVKDEIIEKILESESLPILPAVASKLVEITSREDATMQDIANLISKDVSLSAKILKIANSAFYSFPSQISTINQAVSIIGINAVRSLVLSFSFLTIKAGKKDDNFDYKRFWEKSLAAAVAAKLIMEKVDDADPEEIFVASLLQNIGELVIARVFPDQYGLVSSEFAKGERKLEEIEQEIIGTDHQFVGFEVAKSWGFPETLLTPIKHHHQPDKDPSNDKKLKLLTNVTYLSGLVAEILYSSKPKEAHQEFQEKSKTMLKFEDRTIETILHTVHFEIALIASFFNLKIKEPKSVEDILLEANAALSILNLSYEQINKELITAKVQSQKLTKDLEEKNKHLEKLANIDGLTEVYNHRFFQDSLEKEISRAVRHETTLSIILADVDNFKNFNDTHGHQVGDEILKELCQVINAQLREYDLLARYGGEEFVVVLSETDKEAAKIVAEKLRTAIADNPLKIGHESYNVAMSFGVASMSPSTDTFKKSDLISFADAALYESKKKGRNRVTVYTEKKKWFGKSWG